MSVQGNIELVRHGFEAFIAGDMVWLNEHLHENIVWHVPGHNALSGSYGGREQVLAMFAGAVAIALPEFDIHDVVGSEDHIVVLANIVWRRQDTGDRFEGHEVFVFHLEGEQAIEVWNLSEDSSGFDAFVSGAA